MLFQNNQVEFSIFSFAQKQKIFLGILTKKANKFCKEQRTERDIFAKERQNLKKTEGCSLQPIFIPFLSHVCLYMKKTGCKKSSYRFERTIFDTTNLNPSPLLKSAHRRGVKNCFWYADLRSLRSTARISTLAPRVPLAFAQDDGQNAQPFTMCSALVSYTQKAPQKSQSCRFLRS